MKIVNGKRKCKNCGKKPTAEGYDACIGYVEGVVSIAVATGRKNLIKY